MTLQDVADGLANALRRPVLISDRTHRALATSQRYAEPDGMRLVDLLRGPAQAATRRYLDQAGVVGSRQAVRVDLELFGVGERLAAPVRHGDRPVATVWLPTTDLPALTSLDYSSIDAAVSITRDLLMPPGPTDDATVSRTSGLLHENHEIRRRTFAGAVAEGWLARGEQTVVWALDLEPSSPVQRLALGRHFTGTRTPRLRFLLERDEHLLFVSTRWPRSAVDEALRDEAHRRSLVVRALGSAQHDGVDDDLAAAAGQAVAAAALVRRIPHRPGTADISELGVWLMLSSVVADRAQLARFSPAADVLWSSGDSLQRETVETYLDVRGQAKDACQRLHVHRTTLYYRLDHLPEVVRDALADGMQRSALHLCLKLIRLWEATDRL
ncbi:PucR family transcriptional regulator [Microlunatus flavus]|uniref:PucR C-terminal helix-turn-helix domain-containing protein n=1 Tax=Microlunatus flavus TaxID=1036181 RepID=A0A1H9NBK0_9ACTN|nr:helix-turn-helix domain-containing protein [Microlunatus flavus]SER33324.1 PucR C-terminal helix-turn-helix domain-containing protein [Microlunatus flavus]